EQSRIAAGLEFHGQHVAAPRALAEWQERCAAALVGDGEVDGAPWGEPRLQPANAPGHPEELPLRPERRRVLAQHVDGGVVRDDEALRERRLRRMQICALV